MAGWSVGSGGSSTPSAAMTAPAGKRAVLKGVSAKPHINASAALLAIHAGDAAGAVSTIVVAYSTGVLIEVESSNGLISGKYVSADMTSNVGTTLASVIIWGDYE